MSIRESEIIEVDFQGGPGRDHPGAVNYMLARVPVDSDIIELYAEEPYPAPPYPTANEDPDASSRFDDESYPRLKTEILRQASAEGIPVSMLKFWWD